MLAAPELIFGGWRDSTLCCRLDFNLASLFPHSIGDVPNFKMPLNCILLKKQSVADVAINRQKSAEKGSPEKLASGAQMFQHNPGLLCRFLNFRIWKQRFRSLSSCLTHACVLQNRFSSAKCGRCFRPIFPLLFFQQISS